MNKEERVEIYGARLKEVREHFALSLNAFGNKIGLSGSRVSKLERTDKVTLSKEVYNKLIDTFQINPTYLTVAHSNACKMIIPSKKKKSNKAKPPCTADITEETTQPVDNDVVSEHESDDINTTSSDTVDDDKDSKYGFTTDSSDLEPSDLYAKLTEDISEQNTVTDKEQESESQLRSDSFYNMMQSLDKMAQSPYQQPCSEYNYLQAFASNMVQPPAPQSSQQVIPLQMYPQQAITGDSAKILNILANFDQEQISTVLTFVKYMKDTDDSPKAIKSLIKALKSFKSIKIVL